MISPEKNRKRSTGYDVLELTGTVTGMGLAVHGITVGLVQAGDWRESSSPLLREEFFSSRALGLIINAQYHVGSLGTVERLFRVDSSVAARHDIDEASGWLLGASLAALPTSECSKLSTVYPQLYQVKNFLDKDDNVRAAPVLQLARETVEVCANETKSWLRTGMFDAFRETSSVVEIVGGLSILTLAIIARFSLSKHRGRR